MELDLELSSLEITHKRRRLSGILKRSTLNQINVMDAPDEPQTSEDNQTSTKSVLHTCVNSEENIENMNDTSRRSSRVRRPANLNKPEVPSVPKSLNLDNRKAVEKIYLSTNCKRTNLSLETIFEEPLDEKLMSSRKFKRTLAFESNVSQKRLKSKKRVMKAKQISARKRIAQKKITMEYFKKHLADLDSDNECTT